MENTKIDFSYIYKSECDILNEVRKYILYMSMGKTDPLFSIIASQLHDALMRSLGISHENERCRKSFASLLNYIKRLIDKSLIAKIERTNDNNWVIRFTTERFEVIGRHELFNGLHSRSSCYGVVFKVEDGYERVSSFHDGSDNGSSGYAVAKAKMTDQMKQKIYSMGLIPALQVDGSYHENWVYSVGILPEFLNDIKKEQETRYDVPDLYLSCEYDEDEY